MRHSFWSMRRGRRRARKGRVIERWSSDGQGHAAARLTCALAGGIAGLPRAARGRRRHDVAPASADGQVPEPVEEALGGDVTELPNGLYEVDPARGPRLHDPRPRHRGRGRSRPRPEPRPRRSRAPAGLRDGDYYQHVLYAHRSGQPNRYATRSRPRSRRRCRRINAVLNLESLASGGGTADYKVLCDGGGRDPASTPTARPPGRRASTSVVNAAQRRRASTTPTWTTRSSSTTTTRSTAASAATPMTRRCRRTTSTTAAATTE